MYEKIESILGWLFLCAFCAGLLAGFAGAIAYITGVW